MVPLEGLISPPGGEIEGAVDYAQEGGEVAEIFGDFCRKSLCMESWDFIVDAVAYKVYDLYFQQTNYATQMLTT